MDNLCLSHTRYNVDQDLSELINRWYGQVVLWHSVLLLTELGASNHVIQSSQSSEVDFEQVVHFMAPQFTVSELLPFDDLALHGQDVISERLLDSQHYARLSACLQVFALR